MLTKAFRQRFIHKYKIEWWKQFLETRENLKARFRFFWRMRHLARKYNLNGGNRNLIKNAITALRNHKWKIFLAKRIEKFGKLEMLKGRFFQFVCDFCPAEFLVLRFPEGMKHFFDTKEGITKHVCANCQNKEQFTNIKFKNPGEL